MTGEAVGRLIGKLSLTFGATILILAFFGSLVLLLDSHGAGFWEVLHTVRYVPFVAWGGLFSGIGIILLWLSRNK